MPCSNRDDYGPCRKGCPDVLSPISPGSEVTELRIPLPATREHRMAADGTLSVATSTDVALAGRKGSSTDGDPLEVHSGGLIETTAVL